MKKTWKRWLGTVAAALVTSTALAQSPNEAGVVTMRGQSPTYSEEGSVQMGRASASATGTGIQQSQFAVDPGDVFEDALGGNLGGYYAENGGVGFASPHNLSDIQWRVGNQSMEASGYDGGYSNINAFIPLSTDGEQSLIFLNPRVNMSGSGNGGLNVGLGYRFFDPADDRVYGVSGWWDYDAGHRAAYNQMGVSLESLGRYFSARFNANMPLNDFNTFYTTNAFGTPFFQGNNIAYRFNFLRDQLPGLQARSRLAGSAARSIRSGMGHRWVWTGGEHIECQEFDGYLWAVRVAGLGRLLDQHRCLQ